MHRKEHQFVDIPFAHEPQRQEGMADPLTSVPMHLPPQGMGDMMMQEGPNTMGTAQAMGNVGQQHDYQSGFFEEAEQSDFMLVDRVRNYIVKLYQKMCENNVQEVRYLYYVEWTNLTNMYYKDVEWPSAREISGLCEENEVFLLCYKELYYRHIFVNGRPLIHHRIESWENYRALFDMFLDGADTSQLQLPLEWLADMIDEFLYQFQDFCTYRHKLQELSEEELEVLESKPDIWKVQLVLGYLTSFVDRSGITKLLSEEQSLSGPNIKLFNVREALGYFSLIGLCRLHCLLGDYRLAVQVLNPIDIEDKRALFTRMSSVHITLFYYLGFAYMMMYRYADAVNVFATILLAHRGSKGRTTCFSDSMIMKKYDKVRALCALAYSLSPGIRIDEQVRSLVLEKYGDNMQLLMQRKEKAFEDIFKYACPKFVNPATPNYSDLQNRHQEAYQLQLKWFLRAVRQQQSLPEIRSYLKLYTSISISKLANFCNLDENIFRERLIATKYKSNQLMHVQDSSPPLEGKRVCVNDFHFYIVGDMVHVEETKRPMRFSQYFMTHALKFQQAIDDLQSKDQRKRTGKVMSKKSQRKFK